MAVGILVLVISFGAIAAGCGYVRTARRMGAFETTHGTVTGREVAPAAGMNSREGRWGRGGGYRPVVTYSYSVDGIAYTADRWSYAVSGLIRSVAEETVAAVPDTVDVHYDPSDPQQAYLHTHTPRIGYALVAAGVVGTLAAVAAILA